MPRPKPNQNDELPPGLSKPALRALQNAGYTKLGQLTGVEESELLALHGMGPKGIAALRSALAEHGKHFRASATR